jgi:hypothetical protein
MMPTAVKKAWSGDFEQVNSWEGMGEIEMRRVDKEKKIALLASCEPSDVRDQPDARGRPA